MKESKISDDGKRFTSRKAVNNITYIGQGKSHCFFCGTSKSREEMHRTKFLGKMQTFCDDACVKKMSGR
jgi:hypothetical protein